MNSRYFKQMVIAALLSFTLGVSAQRSEHEPVPLPGSELRKFHSAIMDQEFQIFVQLPLNYIADGSRQYPVWYNTDGNRSFPMIANMSTVLGFPETGFPQVIVVGIAYDTKDMYDFAAWRTRDLSPVVDEWTENSTEELLRKFSGDTTIQVETGGASRFLSFICDELIPFIEAEYQVDSHDRALGGYSFGGLFTLVAMFERPEMFQRYFAGSPSITYAGNYMFDVEKAFSEGHSDLPARLFLSITENDWGPNIDGVRKMAEVLESRSYPNLDVWTHVFEDEDHTSGAPASVMRAFKVLYKE